MLDKFNGCIDVLCKIIKIIVAVLITAAVALSFIEIIRRYFFRQTFPWADEFIRFTLIYVALVGGAVAYREGLLVCFDSLLKSVKPSIRTAFNYISDVLSLAGLVLCFYLSVNTIMTKSVLTAKSTGLRVPMTVPYFAFVLGFLFMIIFCLERIVNRACNPKKEKEGGNDI